MQIFSSTFSLTIVQQIISQVIHHSFQQKITDHLISTNNALSKQFYSNFIDNIVQQTINSGIVTAKFNNFELLQRPKYVENLEQTLCNDLIRKKSASLFTKFLNKKSAQEIRPISSKSVKTLKNKSKISVKNLQIQKSKANQEVNKKIKYFFSNPKQKNKLLIKLDLNQSKKEQSTKEIQLAHNELREQKIDEKEIIFKILKHKGFCQVKKKKYKSLPSQNFPLLQNVNVIKCEIMDKSLEFKNHRSKKSAFKIDRKISSSNEKKKGFRTMNNKLVQPHQHQYQKQQNVKKVQHQKSDLSENKSHQKIIIKKSIQKGHKESLTILGARQKRAQYAKIHSQAVRKIDECRTKNILKINIKKQNKNLKQKISSQGRHYNQKLIINKKNGLDILLNPSYEQQSQKAIQNGIPNLTKQNKGRISIKLI